MASIETAYSVHVLPKILSVAMQKKLANLSKAAVWAIEGESMYTYAPHLPDPGDLDTFMWQMTPLDSTNVWICVAPDQINGDSTLDHGEWVGLCAGQGPLIWEKYNVCPELATNTYDRDVFQAFWTGDWLYMRPEHRNSETLETMVGSSQQFRIAESLKAMDRFVLKKKPRKLVVRTQHIANHGSLGHDWQTRQLGSRPVKDVSIADWFAMDGLATEGTKRLTEPMGTLFEEVYEIDISRKLHKSNL